MSGRWNYHWRGDCSNQYRNFDGQAFKILLKLVSAGWERQWLTGANNYLLRTSNSHCSNNRKNRKLNSLKLTNLYIDRFQVFMKNLTMGWTSGALTNKGREMTEIGFLVSVSWAELMAHPGNNQPGCFHFPKYYNERYFLSCLIVLLILFALFNHGSPTVH